MLDATAAATIGLYRRYLSPHKGFCCAWRSVTGRRSCSAYALAIVHRIGALALVRALPRQFARCKAAYARWLARPAGPAQRRKDRRHWSDCCDCHCNPCDCADLPCDCSP